MKINSKDYKQPLFGDSNMPNQASNNGYGYEEHEQYINETPENKLDEQYTNNDTTNELDYDSRICIVGSEYNEDIKKLAKIWKMDYKGEVFYDDGEALTDKHKQEQTALYFDNPNTTKTNAFIDDVKNKYPDVEIFTTNILDVDDNLNLDFDGLNDFNLQNNQ